MVYMNCRFSRFLVCALAILIVLLIGCASGGIGPTGSQGSTASVRTEEAVPVTMADMEESGSTEGSAPVMEEGFISYDLHRYALVIGNGKYEEGALANPVNDAKLMASKLADAGFDVYTYQNLTKSGMDDAVSSFVKVVNKDSSATAVVYYAGHGVEVEGVNYLIPVDNAKIESEEDVKIYSYSLDNILSLLNAKEQIIILDACRNNPFKMSCDRATGVKGGLGALKEAKKGVSMSYLFAAQSGQTAKDGDGGNSVFTAILAEEIEKGNVPISQLFNNVAARVKAMTNDEQVPLSSTTGSSFIFQSEELSKAVLAKWSEQLRKAEADLKKQETNGSNNDADAAALAESQAKVALAQAEKEASEKRAGQLKADEEKAKQEAEAAKSRSAELQAKIDAMKIAAENAATQVRMNTVASSTITDAIDEIESNKARIVDINNQVARLSESKGSDLSVEYAKKAREIDDAPYQKAELGSDGKPTSSALAMRQMRKDALKAEYDAMLAEYTAEIAAKMKGSDSEIIGIIKSEAEALGKTEYTMSSLTGGIDISINQYDGEKGGWEMSMKAGSLFSDKIFLSYETLTGKKKVPVVTDISKINEYQEYLDNVDMFDSMFRGDVPVIVVEMTCHVVVGGGTLSYQVVPESLIVRRIDTDTTVCEMNEKELSKRYGNLIIKSTTGLDIRSTDEIKTATVSTKVTVQYRDGIYTEEMTFLIGSVVGDKIISDVSSLTDVIVVDDYHNTYTIGGKGPAGGWIFYDKGYYSDGWRYLEAGPRDIGSYVWGDEGSFGTLTGIGTGKKNTEIIASMSTSRKNNAAKACLEYNGDYDWYDDWFLPSKDELNLMYTNLKQKKLGDFVEGYYWSSSEYSSYSGRAWLWCFYPGNLYGSSRDNNYRVRPIRAF